MCSPSGWRWGMAPSSTAKPSSERGCALPKIARSSTEFRRMRSARWVSRRSSVQRWSCPTTVVAPTRRSRWKERRLDGILASPDRALPNMVEPVDRRGSDCLMCASLAGPTTEGSFSVDIRGLTYADLPRVIAIERRAFPTPWSLAMFVLELSKSSGVCLAAVHEERLVGYLICSRYDTVWHVMNVAVDVEYQHRGVASALLGELYERV